MGARVFDTVIIDRDKLRADMKTMGVTAVQISEALGKAPSYLSTAVLNKKSATRETINRVERAMFKPLGTYITTEEEVNEAPQGNEDLMRRIDKLDERLNNIEACLDAVESAIKSTNTWLARLYAVWTKEEKDDTH